MDAQQPARRVSRDELYKLVWQTPMMRLAEQFGISGNGLAKICDRLDVPYPPRGYWAKLAAGQRASKVKLPARRHDIREEIDIRPTPVRAEPPAQVVVETAIASVGEIIVPETLDGLHPKVRVWLGEHQREQKDREKENRNRSSESWIRPRPLIVDLTERDLYRFRVSSAIFYAVEKYAGKVADAPITGKVTFLVDGYKVECAIVEKMVQRAIRRLEDGVSWTAYPDHHRSGLHSSGLLRVTITTYLRGLLQQWVETADKKMVNWLPEIVGTIAGAGPILSEWHMERQAEERLRLDAEARRQEQRRLKEIDDRRWISFQRRAADWKESAHLHGFVAEMQRRLDEDGEVEIEGRQLSDWIAWAREKIEALDPFHDGLGRLFSSGGLQR